MRAQRDVVRLPLRYFPPSSDGGRGRRATLLPDMRQIFIAEILDGRHKRVGPGLAQSAERSEYHYFGQLLHLVEIRFGRFAVADLDRQFM